MSPALDRLNTALYAEAGIKEYWIVLGTDRKVEVYQYPESGRYGQMRVCEPTDTLESITVPGLKIELPTLFAK